MGCDRKSCGNQQGDNKIHAHGHLPSCGTTGYGTGGHHRGIRRHGTVGYQYQGREGRKRVRANWVDGVVLHGKGLTLFARYLVACGEAKPALAMRGAWYALGHRLGWLDGGTVLRRVAAAYLAGRHVADFGRQGEEWFVERGAAAIRTRQ